MVALCSRNMSLLSTRCNKSFVSTDYVNITAYYQNTSGTSHLNNISGLCAMILPVGVWINSATADRYLQETTKSPVRYMHYQLHL